MVICCLSNYNSTAQENRIETLLSKHHVTCVDVTINSKTLIPEFYNSDNIDTVKSIMQYWEEKCGVCEELIRLKILLAIEADTFDEKMYSNLPIFNYIYLFKHKNEYYQMYHYDNTQIPSFEKFTKNLAERLSTKSNLKLEEKFFTSLYAMNSNGNQFELLNDSTFQHSNLKKQYDSLVKYYTKKSQFHTSIFSGIWLPSKNLKVLGNHPLLGTHIGFEKGRFCYDLTLEFRFLKSANPYWVEKDNIVYKTQHYFGGLAGIDIGYSLLNQNKNQLLISFGIAYEGFDALTNVNGNGVEETIKSINTLNLNPGVSFRRFYWGRNYLGIDIRYNFVDYKNYNGTNLSGNAMSIRFKYGIMSNKLREFGLKQLEYKY